MPLQFTQETTGWGALALYLLMMSRILLLFARDLKKKDGET
jgi:hypothetical protein